jgi:hypothetical protein
MNWKTNHTENQLLLPHTNRGQYAEISSTRRSYECYFVSIWTTAVLAIPATVALLTLGTYTASTLEEEDLEQRQHQLERTWIFFGCAVATLAWTLYVRQHNLRVMIRAGTWPSCCADDAAPQTEAELINAIIHIKTKYGKPPVVVGSGWGYFLQRCTAKGPRLFLHRYVGVSSTTNDDNVLKQRWRSGTTIATVAKHLQKHNFTFSTHPTMDYISLGAWFARGNHGNGGDDAAGSSKTLHIARVIDLNQEPPFTIFQWDYKTLRKYVDASDFGSNRGCYCILDVSFRNLVPNNKLLQQGIIIDSAKRAAEWLAPGAKLRVCFQGAARNYALAIRWSAFSAYNNTAPIHDNPHCGSRACLYIQTDICSVVGGWHESMRNFTARMSHYNANRWMPIVWPIETITIVLAEYYNFEVIFLLEEALDGNRLWNMIQTMINLHQQVGGRSEFRYGTPSKNTPVFMDCAMNRSEAVQLVFDTLLKPPFSVKGNAVALHPGKVQVSTSPCRQVTLARVYGME